MFLSFLSKIHLSLFHGKLRYHGRWIDSVWKSRSYAGSLRKQAEWRFARRTSAIHRQKFHTDDVNVNFIILNKLSFAVTKGLCQATNVLHSHKCMS